VLVETLMSLITKMVGDLIDCFGVFGVSGDEVNPHLEGRQPSIYALLPMTPNSTTLP
jgi:hypothetical protein